MEDERPLGIHTFATETDVYNERPLYINLYKRFKLTWKMNVPFIYNFLEIGTTETNMEHERPLILLLVKIKVK